MANVYAFDVDDCLETGGQTRLPPAAGPVTIASVRAQAAGGDVCGIVGNWMNLPAMLPDWREVFQFLLPPQISGSPKGFWLAWVRAQYPGYQHYVMVGNDPSKHSQRPAYWDQLYPGTLPVTHIPGQALLSDDIGAASQAGFEFIKEDQWAAGKRVGTVPPRDPNKPFYSFPKHQRPAMINKVFSIPGAVKSVNYDSGIVEAIVSVTGNVDIQKDIIAPGAYQKALDSGRLPKVVKQHDWKTWLGRTVDAEELRAGDQKLPEKLLGQGFGGVYVKGEFTMEDPIAAAVHAHLKRGVIDEFSVGFDIDEAGGKLAVDYDEDSDVRTIKSIFPWYEWSPVLMGANPETLPIAVKHLDPDEFAEDDDEEGIEEKAKWSRAFINNLPDSAFAIILPGGKKDSSGKTTPRSLRKLPHHNPNGSLDLPHLRNALVRVAQNPQLARAKAHLRRHASSAGVGGKSDAASDASNATIYVPETTVQTLGAAVGASVAAAYLARQRQHPT